MDLIIGLIAIVLVAYYIVKGYSATCPAARLSV